MTGCAPSVVSDVLQLAGLVLQTPVLTAESEFFDAGGDSLMALQLAALVESHFGIEFSLVDIIEAADMRQVAEVVASRLPPAPDTLVLDAG
jgi:acyl carrier protein